MEEKKPRKPFDASKFIVKDADLERRVARAAKGSGDKSRMGSTRRRETKQPFIRFPVAWRERLITASVSAGAYVLALHIVDEGTRGTNPRKEIRLTQERREELEKDGLGRRKRSTALKELERAGLIEVIRDGHKTLRVVSNFLD
jgi:hypothetical protein